jgi:hypothetical protein
MMFDRYTKLPVMQEVFVFSGLIDIIILFLVQK